MNTLTDIDSGTREAIRAFIEKIALKYEMDRAILFGSRARMSHRSDSDADVAVLLHGRSGKFVATKLAMADIAYEVLLETGIRIQPLPIWAEELGLIADYKGDPIESDAASWVVPEAHSFVQMMQDTFLR